MRNQLGRTVTVGIAVFTAVAVVLFGAIPAWALTVTFVRHGQSQANAEGFIDTSVPGPSITELGQQEAQAIADRLEGNGYDAIFASNMVRTQQTAAPLADELDLDVTVLPGFREIDAGLLEGVSEKEGLGRIAYGLMPMAWVLGLRSLPIPGAADGNAFDARVDDALQTVYDSGSEKPVVFAHGATIMFWVMMNVDNPDPLLIFQHPLGNTAVVVVNGSSEDGWTLENWDGIEVAADASLPTKLFVNVRDLITAPQTSIYEVVQALETGDPAVITTAIRDAAVQIATAPAKFVGAVTRDVVDAVHDAIPAPAADHRQSAPLETAASDESTAVATDAPAEPESESQVENNKVEDKADTADRVTPSRRGNDADVEDLTDTTEEPGATSDLDSESEPDAETESAAETDADAGSAAADSDTDTGTGAVGAPRSSSRGLPRSTEAA
jgi:broad specificity phosphatase PhoE